MTRSHSSLALVLVGVFISLPLPGQIVVDTFAGGRVPSGVPAANVSVGQIAGLAWDPAGGLVFCDRTANLIRRIRPDGVIETTVGDGTTGFAGDGGQARNATLNWPGNPRYDGRGNLYFADLYNYRIRRVDTRGVITTVGGDGIPLQPGMDLEGPALQRSVGIVVDLAVDGAGNVFFTEQNSGQIRRVTPAGRIEVFANANAPGLLATDDAGNLYVVEGTYSNLGTLRRIAPDRSSTPIAGYGPFTNTVINDDGMPAVDAYLYQIVGLAAVSGKVYIIQGSIPGIRNNFGTRIRRIDENGIIRTIAGGAAFGASTDGPALQAYIVPLWLTADSAGNVAFVDAVAGLVNTTLIREVTAQSDLKTLAGADPKAAPDGTPARDAWFLSPTSIALSRAGDVFVAEVGGCRIRKIGPDGLLKTVAGTGKCAETHVLQPATGPDLPPPSSLAIDSRNRIYMLDVSGNPYVITTDGLVTPASLPLALGRGKIAIDAKDRVYVLGLFSLARVSADGKQETVVGPPNQPGVPPPGFGPTSMAAIGTDPSGNVYFTGTYLGSPTDYVFRVNDDGTFRQLYGSPASPLHLLNSLSLAADATGTVWSAAGGLSAINAAGQLALGKGMGYSGDGGLAQSARFNTSAVAVAATGELYLLDNDRIRRLSGLTPARAPVISAAGIVNAANYAGGAIAPGELISIFGSNFGDGDLQTASSENNRLPFGLGRIKVLFDGYAGAVTAVTPTQINVFVPYWLDAGKSTNIVVQADATGSNEVSMPVVNTAPGIFPVVLNQDGSINSATRPAAPGSVISLYGTGEGRTNPQLIWGDLILSTPYPQPAAPVTVSVGGERAEVLYAGSAPFLPTGIWQVNARVPSGSFSGTLPVSVTVGGNPTLGTLSVAR